MFIGYQEFTSRSGKNYRVRLSLASYIKLGRLVDKYHIVFR